MTRASGTVTSAGTGASSSSGSVGSSAPVLVPNAGTSAQNATVLTGVQYSGLVVDKRAATLPSKYNGKGDITSWINSMRSYFEVLRTLQEDRSMIMGTNIEPAIRSFIELQAVTAGYERIDLTEWLKVILMLVELNRANGIDFSTLAIAKISLQPLLNMAPVRRRSDPHTFYYADLKGTKDGQTIGTLRYSICMRFSISNAVRMYCLNPPITSPIRKKLPPPPGVFPPPSVPSSTPTHPSLNLSSLNSPEANGPMAAAAAAAKASPYGVSAIRICLLHCKGLTARNEASRSRRGLAPYVSYQLPGFPRHDTPFSSGSNPMFDDVCVFPLVNSRAVEKFLRDFQLQMHVFDDNDEDLEDAGLLGSTAIPLKHLVNGQAIYGTYQLTGCRGQVTTGRIRLAENTVIQNPEG
ncbi:hypothetical protein CBR_g20406 [Chara braunii]|uniref:C2 domain-containing protein n=1 Tax=Chara braunii TaxID=69332 RepID=A0A388JUB2_CHABU|nr:hypothetical protein CBR_g20406 [Chara braunii]|eukprot:GBG61375.1 hypothetical protein CBR_g20406 [Chara braunii]